MRAAPEQAARKKMLARRDLVVLSSGLRRKDVARCNLIEQYVTGRISPSPQVCLQRGACARADCRAPHNVEQFGGRRRSSRRPVPVVDSRLSPFSWAPSGRSPSATRAGWMIVGHPISCKSDHMIAAATMTAPPSATFPNPMPCRSKSRPAPCDCRVFSVASPAEQNRRW
jgi:hypothetical protein